MTFQSARTRLTLMYTGILTLILLTFSIIIYSLAMEEVYRSVQEVRVRLRDEYGLFMRPERIIVIDTEALTAARKNIIARLLIANITVLAIAAGASYYLAGKTLKPIQSITKQQQRFLTDASHELRTPLTVMKSTTEVNLRDKNLSLEDARIALKDNLEEINRLQRLTNNLLTLSVNEEGGGLHLERLSVRVLIENAIQIIDRVAQEKKIFIKNNVPDEEILADQDSLIEVLVILLENAIKYSPEKSDVIISTRHKGDCLTILIEDHGKGMSEEESEHIFDRFYRTDSSRSSKGFGLGLAIAKKLIDMQHGTISIKSLAGRGSTFFITLHRP